jgi:hypothetical protein
VRSFLVMVPVRIPIFPNLILETKYCYCACNILRRAKKASPFVTFCLELLTALHPTLLQCPYQMHIYIEYIFLFLPNLSHMFRCVIKTISRDPGRISYYLQKIICFFYKVVCMLHRLCHRIPNIYLCRPTMLLQ